MRNFGRYAFIVKKEWRKESISCQEACSKRENTARPLWNRKPYTCRGGNANGWIEERLLIKEENEKKGFLLLKSSMVY